MTHLFWIGLGGFLGANARYIVTVWIAQQVAIRTDSAFPFGTLIVNFSGSLLPAMFIVWSARQVSLPDNLRLLVGTGFFGAYTIFSTFANESFALAQTEHWLAAAVNVIGTNLLCLLGVLVGFVLARYLFTV